MIVVEVTVVERMQVQRRNERQVRERRLSNRYPDSFAERLGARTYDIKGSWA